MGLKAVANLGGGGGGGISGSGTPGTLAKFTGATALGDSAIVQVAGAIATVTLTAGGAGYTSATYSQQALTGGTGTGATADIVVAGGIVTSCVLRSPGTGYAAADALSCATIGAGAGFVATVATIAQTVNGSGNLTALGRIGAGTATPRAPLDAIGGAIFDGSSRFVFINNYTTSTGSLVYTSSPVGLVVTGTTDASSLGTSFFYPLLVNPLVTNLTGTMQAAHARSIISSSSGAAATVTGLSIVTSRQSVSDLATMNLNGTTVSLTVSNGAGTAASYNQTTMRAFNGSLALQAPGTTTEATFFRAALTTASTPTATTLTAFLQEPTTISTAATITTAYGLRLGAYTLSGGAIITNRWGISQEDTLASNQFSAITNTFSGIVRATGSTAAAPAFSTPADTDTGMYFPSANTVRIGTGGSPGLEIDSSQTLKFNSGFGSTATAYGCRAWINFNGFTSVIRGSGGVSSLTRPSAGNYTINYTTAMPDVNYSAVAMKQSFVDNRDCQLYDYVALRTINSSTWVNVENQAVVDSANINIAFFR